VPAAGGDLLFHGSVIGGTSGAVILVAEA
jgi:hypothetical protein